MSDICVKVTNLSKLFKPRVSSKMLLQFFKNIGSRSEPMEVIKGLDNISFEMDKGEKVAVVGRNASGKTTLLRVLTGIYEKTSGEVEVRERPTALFRTTALTNDNLTIIDNCFLLGAYFGMDRKYINDNMDKMVAFAELEQCRDTPFKDLSWGQQQRFVLSVFFGNNRNFIIIDECLEYMDFQFKKKCDKQHFDQLFSSNKTVIVASHNTAFLKKYCKKAIWLEKGQLRMFGEVVEVIEKYERPSS